MTFSKSDILILELMPHYQFLVQRKGSGSHIAQEIAEAVARFTQDKEDPQARLPRRVYAFRRGQTYQNAWRHTHPKMEPHQPAPELGHKFAARCRVEGKTDD